MVVDNGQVGRMYLQMEKKLTEVEVALREYDYLASYYELSIRQSAQFIDWYFKVVTLPAVVVGYIASGGPGFPQVPMHWVSGMLSVIFFAGFCLFAAYSKESANSILYYKALCAIRNFLRENYPALKSVLVIDILRVRKKALYGLGSIKGWRGGIFAVINSAIATGAILSGCNLVIQWEIGIVIYVGMLLLHIVSYITFVKLYLRGCESDLSD